MKGFGSRLLDLAICAAAAVFLLNWAWSRLQPLLPVLLVLGAAAASASFLVRRFRGW